MKLKKIFNQNLIINFLYINKILFFVKPIIKNIYLELGFGSGSLSKNIILKLLNYNCLIYFIEIDENFFLKFKKIYCKNIFNFNIIKFNFFLFKNFLYYKYNLFIIGNIPYNISTCILYFLIRFIKYINNQYLMFQSDFFYKIYKKKSKLSICLKSFYIVKKIFLLDNDCFFPKPNIKSIFVNFTPLYLSLINFNDFYLFDKFLKLILKKKNHYKIIFNLIKTLKLKKKKKILIDDYILYFTKFKKKFIKFN